MTKRSDVTKIEMDGWLLLVPTELVMRKGIEAFKGEIQLMQALMQANQEGPE